MNREKRYDTFAVLMSIFLITASAHIIVPLPFGEVVQNVIFSMFFYYPMFVIYIQIPNSNAILNFTLYFGSLNSV
jgi:hypothetical protein